MKKAMRWIKDICIIGVATFALLFACLEILRFAMQENETFAKGNCGPVEWPGRFTTLSGSSSFVPGKTLRWTTKANEFCAESKINSLGYPDHEPENGDAILILGDSFVEGAQLSLNKNDKLQDQVKRLYLERQGVEKNVVAVGYSGTGQTAQAMMLKEVLNQGLVPRDLILVIVPNDVRDNSHLMSSILNNFHLAGSPRPYYVRRPNQELELQYPDSAGVGYYKLPINLDWFLMRYQSLIGPQLAYQIVNNMRLSKYKKDLPNSPELASITLIAKDYDLMFGSDDPNLSLVETAWEATDKSIALIKEICEKCKIRAIFAYQFSMQPFELHRRRFGELMKKYDIEYSVQKNDNQFHWKTDGHWNKKGAGDAAELIYSMLNRHLYIQ